MLSHSLHNKRLLLCIGSYHEFYLWDAWYVACGLVVSTSLTLSKRHAFGQDFLL
jgi:hypothetical protein